MKDIEISNKMFRKNLKTDGELIFTGDKMPQVINYICTTKLDLIGLGILLMFAGGV